MKSGIGSAAMATRCLPWRPERNLASPIFVSLGALAADVTATAVVRAATQATGLPTCLRSAIAETETGSDTHPTPHTRCAGVGWVSDPCLTPRRCSIVGA